MHILHIVESFATGTFEFIRLLVKYLPNERHTIIFSERELSIDDAKNKFHKSVEFIPWSYAQREIGINDIKATVFLRKELSKLEYDIIHLHSSKAGALGRLGAFLIQEQRVIFTPNGASFARKDISTKNKWFNIFIEYLLSKLTGKVICCSKTEMELFRKYGINANYIANGTEVFDNRSNSKFDDLTIVTSGRIGPQKNPELFNSIAKEFESSKLKFLWIGDGKDRTKLNSTNIDVTGWVAREKAIELIQKSHIYLSTALWEGLPFAVLEAMAAGLPTLLSDIPAHQELTENAVNGFLFSSGPDATKSLLEMIKHNNLAKLGDNSKKIIEERFSANEMAKSYKEIYNSLRT